jgi:hypothetical protein
VPIDLQTGIRIKKAKTFLSLALMVSGIALAQPRKIAPDLNVTAKDKAVDVIVPFDSVPSLDHHSKVTKRGGRLKLDLSTIKSGAYTMPATAIADLAGDLRSGISRPIAG